MAIDLKQYFTSLAQEGQLDDATRDAILKAVENEKFSKKLGDELMTRSDYSRAHDDLKKQLTAFEEQKEAWKKWAGEVDAVVKQREAEAVQARAQLNAYKETFGDLSGGTGGNGSGDGKAAAAAAFDPNQFQAALNQQFQALQTRLLGTVVDTAKVQGDYFQTFGKPMTPAEVDELAKTAASQNRPIMDVYRDYVAPKIAEKNTVEWEAKLKQAREDGAKDALSKHQIPVDASPKGPSPFLSKVQTDQKTATNPQTESERRNAFVAAWNSAPAGGSK